MIHLLDGDDLTNPGHPFRHLLDDYTALTDVRLRSRIETERGLYMAESFYVISRALNGGHRPRSFLMSERWLPQFAEVFTEFFGDAEGGDIPVFIADEAILEQLIGFHLHRGAMAAMHRPEMPPVDALLTTVPTRPNGQARRVAILEDLVDHTNVGAAFRSAAALAIDAVLVTPSCADPLYRRSVRVSMGTVFQVPWTRLDDWNKGTIDQLHSHGFTVAALALSNDSVSLDEFVASPACTEPNSKVALVFGAEGDGLKARTINNCDVTVRIPMAGGVDSLNVAAASAVAFWATRT